MFDLAPTYSLNVDGEGEFVFARRTMRLNLAIGVEAARLDEGVALDDFLKAFVVAMATLAVLTVKAPTGWSPEELDPLETDSYSRVLKVWSALCDKEQSFRKGTEAAR